MRGGAISQAGKFLRDQIVRVAPEILDCHPNATGFSDDYLPTICSAPEIEVILVEVPGRWGPLGAKGLGEGAILPTPPAILNGIHNATGARLRELPATPERVQWAMRHAEVRDAGG